MNTERIEFISAYCDNWCERCAYTLRCSSYEVRAALGMCGDPGGAIELALGEPRSATAGSGVPEKGLAKIQLTARELTKLSRREKAKNASVRSAPVMQAAWAIGTRSDRWLSARADGLRQNADGVLFEALEVASHDAFLITAKLNRASRGLFDHRRGDDFGDDAVQNDWNGSAKLALVCLERSEAAWQVIAQATGDDTPAAIAAQLGDLRVLVEQSFPDARRFIRPGFDEPWR